MTRPAMVSNRRILVVDDNADVLSDFRKVLCPATDTRPLSALEKDLFGDAPPKESPRGYDAVFAPSGPDALDAARQAAKEGRPFMMAFVDMRMPGWNGIETIKRLWTVQPNLEIAICSAYMDYSWHDVIEELKRPGLRLVRKPWTSSEVLGVVHELSRRAAVRAATT